MAAVRARLYAEASALLLDAERRGTLLAPPLQEQEAWVDALAASGAFDAVDWPEHWEAVAELVQRFEAQRLSGRWRPPARELPPRADAPNAPGAPDALVSGATAGDRRAGQSTRLSRRRQSARAAAVRAGWAWPLARMPLEPPHAAIAAVDAPTEALQELADLAVAAAEERAARMRRPQGPHANAPPDERPAATADDATAGGVRQSAPVFGVPAVGA
eukprot:7328462-Prymnesium_polylepis.1